MAKLGEVCDILNGYAFKSNQYTTSGVRIIRISNVQKGYIEDKSPVYYPCDDENVKKYELKQNDLLISLTGNVGRTALLEEKFLPAALNQRVSCVRLKEPDKVLKTYLFHLLNSDYFEQQCMKAAEGVAQKNLSPKWLFEYKIPIYSIERQKEISNTLDKIDLLIILRKQQLAKLDELVKARFVEMFGTFPANPFRWSIGKIQDVVSDVRYGSSRPAVEGGKYPYLRMNNITYSGELDLRDTKRIDIPDSELDKCTVRRGDVLFNRTNSKELVGKTCVYNRDELMVLAGFVIRVRINERIRPEVLSAFLNMDFSKRMLIGMCKTAIGQANINAKELQNIDLYIPPIELQDQFVTLKNKVDQQKQMVQQSLEKLELMKKALMQEYFG